jgi:hypothetical protein
MPLLASQESRDIAQTDGEPMPTVAHDTIGDPGLHLSALEQNTAIFSLIDALMLRMLPVREPEGLVMPVSQYPGEPDNPGFSWTVFERLRDQNHVFSDLFGVSPAAFR